MTDSSMNSSIRLHARDRDDMRFDLRKHKRRVEELYEGRGFYDLSSEELNVARKIIVREAQQAIAPTFKPPVATPVPVPAPGPPSAVASSVPSSSAATSSIASSAKTAVPPATTSNGILSKLYAQDKRNATAAATAANKKVVASGSVPVNFSLTAPVAPVVNPQARLQETQGIRLIGNSIVDYQRLMQNAQSDQRQLQQQKNKDNPSIQAKENKKQKALMDEVDALLNRKSTHDSEATEEWHRQYNQTLQKLEKREFIQNKLDSIQFIEVPAFQCRQCENHIYPTFPESCRGMEHQVREVTAIKRFFDCANCGGRDSTLTNKATDHTHIPAPPSWRCRCGQYRWVVKGSARKSEKTTSFSGESLVTAASESTSRRDAMEMAVRVSKLSELK